VEVQLPKQHAEFSVGGQVGNSSVPGKNFIHPFLPNICEFLKTEFTGNGVENLFQGNFVDRVDLYDGNLPSELIWDPLNVSKHPHRQKDRRIYCLLAKTINQIYDLKKTDGLTQKTKYFLCLYEDMHIPLINYIEMLIEKQRNHLKLISYSEHGSEPILIPEFRIHGGCKKTFIQRIMKHKSYDRFDKLIDAKKFILTDDYLCTQINLSNGKVIPPPAVHLQPEMKLFDEGEVFHEGMLPDVLRYVINCNFFTETKKNHPLVHLISKSLPQRCTIRNLSDILHEYSRKHDYVYDFVIACMKCSMLGLYKNSRVRPPFHVRKVLLNVFKNKTKNEFLQWMLMDHQQLLFYIIKEFLVFACRLVPSLYNEIIRRYSWTKFEEGVMTAMNAVRKYEFWEKNNPMLFSNVESMLASVNKQQIHHLYRPIKTSFAFAVMSECIRIDEERCVTKSNTVTEVEWKDIMYKLAIRTKEKIMPFYLLECFHVSQNSINSITQIQEIFMEEGSKSSLKQFLYSLPRNEFEAIRDFADAFDMKHNIRIFDLPCHTYINQCIALRRKHRVPNGVSMPDHVGEVMLCLNCKSFKSFINHFDNKGNVCNLYAYGFQKVLVEDDCDGDTLKVYCGKRCDKSDGKKRHNYSSEYSSFLHLSEAQLKETNNERQRKREAKEFRKEDQNDICSDTELVRVNLLGRILQFYGKLYTLCPSCGNAFTYSGKYFNGKNGFYCGCCLSEDGELYTTISCSHCMAIKNNESWQPLTVKGEVNEEERRQIYLCNSCYKPWIRDSTQLLKMSTIHKGLKEKWKRLKHPSNN
jgi:hypothetical protein